MASHSLYFPVDKEVFFRQELERNGFSFRSLQYGYWQAVKTGVVISLYTSGRLVLQGEESAIRFVLDLVVRWLEKPSSQIGCDECGKGDVFGPLVMVAVGISAANYTQLQLLGISESKKATQSQLNRWYGEIRNLCQVEQIVWEPEAYNELYDRYKNLNTLLTLGYEDLLRRFDGQWEKVIIDAYTQDQRTREVFLSVAPGKLILEPHAERYPVVGAASLVARRLFEEWFEKQSKRFPKGSGQAAKDMFFAMKAIDSQGLRQYAKVHFFEEKSLF